MVNKGQGYSICVTTILNLNLMFGMINLLLTLNAAKFVVIIIIILVRKAFAKAPYF